LHNALKSVYDLEMRAMAQFWLRKKHHIIQLAVGFTTYTTADWLCRDWLPPLIRRGVRALFGI
jgi:hypothetical protein